MEIYGVIAVFFFVALIGIYITALVLSKKTSCVIIWGWKDLIVLALLSITIIAITVIAAGDFTEQEGALPFLGIVAVALFVITVIHSILANVVNLPPTNILYIAISILAKLVLLAVIPIIILLHITYSSSDSSYKKDGRYRVTVQREIRKQKQSRLLPLLPVF